MLKLYEVRALLYAAKHCEIEAETWADGFAVRQKNGEPLWNDKEYDWAHLRYLHLKAGAKSLREIAARNRPLTPAP